MPNASDIITFIGVPLAVLGVLPILYTAINSLLTIRRIRLTLERNGLSDAITRGSLMSGVVEVSLPRFSITPLDREEDSEYWDLNPNASNLKGGTWTTFNWNCLITGSKLYRLQYSSDLEVPQAEIEFEELLAFLLDRGAVPDVKGLHMLRVSGLWTPTGTNLMLSPDTLRSALRVSVPNDSDGVLSLALCWDKAWDNRDPNFLPPGWMRLYISAKIDDDTKSNVSEKPDVEQFPPEKVTKTYEKPTQLRPMSLRFHLDHTGTSVAITNASWEHENTPLHDHPSLDHLRPKPASTWIPSIALALGLSRSLPLYNYSLDPELSTFATHNTVPCGILVTLGILDEAEAPPWETKYNPREHMLRQHANFMASQREMAAERMMTPDQARIAKANRQSAELSRLSDQSRQDMEQRRQRAVNRQREAVGSSRLDTTIVAITASKYLKAEKLMNESGGIDSAVEALLMGMIINDEQAMSVCIVLERWRQWSDRGGMVIEDLEFLEKNKVAFCNAACVVGILREVGTKEESSVASDMRESVQSWRKVRLG